MMIQRNWSGAILAWVMFGLLAALTLASAPAHALTPSTTTIAVAPSPATVGQTVTLTAMVTGSSPTGTVQFLYNGSTVITTAPLVNGQATFTYTAPNTQPFNLSAAYSGDGGNQPSTSATFVVTTNAGSSATVFTSSTTTVAIGQATTLTATVTPASATGTVTFKDGTTTLGTGTLSAGVATLAKSFSTTGTHSLTATYAGDGNYLASTSSAVVETVNAQAAASTTALAVAPSPATVGQAVTLTATVTGSSPTGTVQFLYNGSTVITTAPLVNGQATFTYTAPNTQPFNLSAAYSGDGGNQPSTSATFVVTTNAGSSATVLTSSATTVAIGQATTLIATVTPAATTGSVVFKDGATTLATVSLASGVATYSATFATAGSHSLTAVYGGDANYLTSTTAGVNETVTAKATTTGLTSSVNPAAVGQNTTLTAAVTPSTATGTVTFKDGGTTLGTGTVASGVATYAASFATTGSHSLTAVYGGDASDATSTSNAVSESVTSALGSTTTVLSSSVNPAAAGQSTTLTATVTPSTATGTVTFKDGATTLGTGTLASGVATYAASFAATGAHSITAVYAGDASDAASTSSAVSETVTTKSTSTVLTSSVNPAAIGQSTTLTATVMPSTATGTVAFKDGATTLGTGTLASGVATYATTFATTGAHSLTAVYAGDASDATSTSSAVSETVTTKATTTALTTSVNPAAVGQSTTLTATVTPSTATGTVTFKDGATTLGTGTLASGVATFAVTFATTGAHGLTTVYAGDANDAASTSSSVSETVTTKATTTALTSSVNPAEIGQNTTLTATVTPSTATGTVTFQDGATTLGTGTLASGVATYAATFATTGSHSLTAVYAGDASDATSTSSAVSETVTTKSTSTALTSSVNPAALGQSTTLTATVMPSTATGTVTFKDGATTLGTGTLASGVATYVATFAATGAHSVTAVYGGDASDAASTSTAVTETVTSSITTSSLSLTPSANPIAAGGSLTLSASVGGSTPTGTVQFKDGTTNLESAVALISGQASYSLTPSSAGGHLYSATYSGDTNNTVSSGQAAVNVTGATSTTTLGASATAATPFTSVTLSATVTGSSPTGSVVFRDGATVLQTSTLAAGVATWAQTFANGLHVITASYAGDTTNGASVSTATLVQVSPDGSSQPPGAALQTNYEYDAQGNLTKVMDANSATKLKAYDSLERATTITQPVPAVGQAAPTIGLGYDLQDQPATVTDPRNLSTSYTVDGLGNATAQTSPDTGSTSRTFYDNGLLKTSTDARGKTTTYTYDALDRVKTVVYSDGGTGITYNYDEGVNGAGHLTSFSDESGSTTLAYDGFGRVRTKSQTSGPAGGQQTFTLTYTWGTTGSATGKLQAVQYPSGAVVTYGYDGAGRVNDLSVTGADGVVTKVLSGVEYTALTQVGDWVWGDGTPYRRVFDGYGRLVSYPLGNPNGTGASAGVVRTLAFDAAGRIVGYSHSTAPNWDQLFGYDGLDRLTSATLSGGNTYAYAYDPTGNRTQTTINGTPYASTVSATSNWYTNVATAAGGSTTQGYDAAGHLTSDAGGTYAYSDRGRLKSELRSGNTFSYLYNALEQRVYKGGPASIITTGKSYYVYDEAGHLAGEYDATGKAIYETVYLGDMPVAALTAPAIGQTTLSYVYADHLNTARVIVRPADQAIVWQWGSNEPFGQSQANSNPNGLGVYTYNPRFPGQVADAESGWFYNWHRDYNPALGRYDQFDPMGLGGGINGYGYVGGNPLSRVDPRGLYGCKMVGPVMVCDLTPPPIQNPDYPVYPQNPSLVPQWLNDWSNTFNQARDNLVDKITDKACKVDEKEKECEAQWEAAEQYCNRLYGRGYRPSPDGRGVGGMKWQQCVKGQVDEACGGNKVEH